MGEGEGGVITVRAVNNIGTPEREFLAEGYFCQIDKTFYRSCIKQIEGPYGEISGQNTSDLERYNYQQGVLDGQLGLIEEAMKSLLLYVKQWAVKFVSKVCGIGIMMKIMGSYKYNL